MIPGAPENKRLTPAYENKAHVIHHYTPMQKLGYPSGVKCWCGSVLEFRYHEPGMKQKRQAFFAEHTDCVPSSEIIAS